MARFLTRPWEKANPYGVPFQVRHWWANAKQGRLWMCEEDYERVTEYEGGPVTIKATPKSNRNVDGPILDFDQVEQIYSMSAKRNITLMDAVIELVGQDGLSPSWIKRAKDAPKCYAVGAEPKEVKTPTQNEVAKRPKGHRRQRPVGT